MLTRGAGLGGRIEIVCGDALALPFADDSFDVAWTQAVGQNIADKRALHRSTGAGRPPGGRVAMFEIVAGPGGRSSIQSRGPTATEQSSCRPPKSCASCSTDEGR